MNDLRMTCVLPSFIFSEGENETKRFRQSEGGRPLVPNSGQSPVTRNRTSGKIRSSFISSYRFPDGLNSEMVNDRDTGTERIGELGTKIETLYPHYYYRLLLSTTWNVPHSLIIPN